MASGASRTTGTGGNPATLAEVGAALAATAGALAGIGDAATGAGLGPPQAVSMVISRAAAMAAGGIGVSAEPAIHGRMDGRPAMAFREETRFRIVGICSHVETRATWEPSSGHEREHIRTRRRAGDLFKAFRRTRRRCNLRRSRS